jgi:hypothetical protein
MPGAWLIRCTKRNENGKHTGYISVTKSKN